MNTTYKFLIIVTIAVAMAFSNVYAQENEEPNRLSIGVMGGATIGHMNIGTEYDPTFGLNARYAFSPDFAIQTNFMFGKFTTNDNDDNLLERSFENSYGHASINSQLGLLSLLGSDSENLNVYANVGLGVIFNDVTTNLGFQSASIADEFMGEDHSEKALVGSFGTGVRYNVSSKIDLFAQYDYNITTSDLIDGHRTRPETKIDLHRRTPDSWSALTFGVQIKLGSSERDGDWHRYTPGVDMSAFNRLEAKIAELASRVDHQDSRIDQNEDLVLALQNRMDEFDEKLANLNELINERPSVELTVGSEILFALDSSVIRETAKPALVEIARALLNNPDKELEITGHTCDLGSNAYNQGLSERRATAVKQYLVESGIDSDRITTMGKGELQPLVPNTSEEARSLNRRVEMVID